MASLKEPSFSNIEWDHVLKRVEFQAMISLFIQKPGFSTLNYLFSVESFIRQLRLEG